MAIDVLSRKGFTPIIVGDENDMDGIMSVVPQDGPRKAGVVLASADGRVRIVELSPESSANFRAATEVLLVALESSDEIAYAHLYRIGDGSGPIRSLSEPEIKDIAETLVQEDFRLDYLR